MRQKIDYPKIIQAIRDNFTSEKPLQYFALAKSLNVCHGVIAKAARMARIPISPPEMENSTGILFGYCSERKKFGTVHLFHIGPTMLRRAKLENEKTLAFEITDGAITLRRLSPKTEARTGT